MQNATSISTGVFTRLKEKKLCMRLKKLTPLYIMLLPAVLYAVIFLYYPMYGAQIAFRDFKFTKGITGSDWVGLKHFIKFINYYEFWRIVKNTVILSLYGLIAQFVVRTVLSLSLNSMVHEKYKKFIQTITYMPHFISTVVMIGLLIRFFNPRMGALSFIIQAFGGTERDLMGIPSAIPHLYVWSGIWQNAGWSTILYLAVLSGVDLQLHEAAVIDGASRIKRVWYIDLPALIPTMVICLILDFGGIMNVGFEKILLMQNNLNLSTSQVISTYVYSLGIAAPRPQYSYAAAIGLFNSAITFILIIIVNKTAKTLGQSSLW